MFLWIGPPISFLTTHKKIPVQLPLLTILAGIMVTPLFHSKVAAATIKLMTTYKQTTIVCGIDGSKETFRASKLNSVYEGILPGLQQWN